MSYVLLDFQFFQWRTLFPYLGFMFVGGDSSIIMAVHLTKPAFLDSGLLFKDMVQVTLS